MFNGREELNSHLQIRDSNKPELRCEACGKRYSTRLGLKRHLASHAGSVTGDLTCKVCRQAFETMPSLLEHLSTHTGRPPPPGGAERERKHQCERCGRRFFTRKDVRRHAVVHTGRRDFLCPRCAQRFGRRDHLTRHLKKSHAQELEPAGSAPSSGLKEEPNPVCVSGSPKDEAEAFAMGVFNPQGLQASSASGVGHHHAMVPAPAGCYFEPSKPQQYHEAHASATSYLKAEMENFLNELQCGPMPPQATVATSASRPGDLLPDSLGGQNAHFTLRNSAFPSAEPNVDLSPLLGFLPFGLPPYSAPLSSAGLVMGYSTTTTTRAPTPTSQLSGPLASFQPQSLHEPLAPGHLSQRPGFSPTLPRFHQAFQ